MHLRAVTITLLVTLAAVVAGCGAVAHLGPQSAADLAQGEKLFKMTTLPGKPQGEGCASCHTLAAAGTTGALGPNLDSAFGPDRCQKVGNESTIRDVVRGQIAYSESNPGTGHGGMPANLVVGQNAKDIAAYVASVAGVSGTPGKSTPPYWDCATGVEVTSAS